ncbi:response regulator [Amycolatopsis sp. cg9]|uniref:response regulator n=1 Tax=Amycolatopsis sp. cg9 TaxID=3238801 RepID=UPI0035235AE8
MASVITVGAIDDDQLLLTLAKHWFESLPDIRLTHTAATVAEYLAQNPNDDVVLLDLNLRDGSRPRNNVERLVRHGDNVIVVSVNPDKEFVWATLEAGAIDYLTKNTRENALGTLVASIRAAATGHHTISHELAFIIGRDRRSNRPHLSDREHETVEMYGKGMTIDAVAARLHVQPGTARSYLHRARLKYAEVGRPFRNRTELQQRLREDGIDPLPPV